MRPQPRFRRAKRFVQKAVEIPPTSTTSALINHLGRGGSGLGRRARAADPFHREIKLDRPRIDRRGVLAGQRRPICWHRAPKKQKIRGDMAVSPPRR
jgi:hypothetical protein